jgi:hypothetical protein
MAQQRQTSPTHLLQAADVCAPRVRWPILKVSSKEKTPVKKLMIFGFALVLLMSAAAVAQDSMKQDSMKSDSSMKATTSVTGKISDDGKSFVSDKDGKTWTISNPDAVKGHEGHHVTLKAQANADKGEVKVMSLKMAKDSGMKKDSMQH